jgi:hypothetical protein
MDALLHSIAITAGGLAIGLLLFLGLIALLLKR